MIKPEIKYAKKPLKAALLPVHMPLGVFLLPHHCASARITVAELPTKIVLFILHRELHLTATGHRSSATASALAGEELVAL
jgi:hypothetical protein